MGLGSRIDAGRLNYRFERGIGGGAFVGARLETTPVCEQQRRVVDAIKAIRDATIAAGAAANRQTADVAFAISARL